MIAEPCITRTIGFDVRLAPEIPDRLWDEQRRSVFLLRDDVDRPLAADQQVWPTEFSDADDSEWRGVLNHWSDLAAMCETARARKLKGVTVATAIVWDFLPPQERQKWASERLDETRPASLGREWSLLGYDVADAWLTSGLSNCGYIGDERAEWSSKWRRKLNEFHLLRSPLDAQTFVDATNRRVPEHAPFFAYALFCIREPSSIKIAKMVSLQ